MSEQDAVALLKSLGYSVSKPDSLELSPELESMRRKAKLILVAVFGLGATFEVTTENNPEGGPADVVFRLGIPERLRDRRALYLDIYSKKVQPPAQGPIPILLWCYHA
jgi:hypothetical protein